MAAQFSSQDYDVLADLLSDVKLRVKTHARQEAVGEVVRSLSAFFADDNPRFDTLQFKRACGFEPDGSEPIVSTKPPSSTEREDTSDYEGEGRTSIDLGNGYEVLLTVGAFGPAALRARRIERTPGDLCWWIADISREGLTRHSGVPSHVVSTSPGGYVYVKEAL